MTGGCGGGIHPAAAIETVNRTGFRFMRILSSETYVVYFKAVLYGVRIYPIRVSLLLLCRE